MLRTRRRRLARILLVPLSSALLGGLLSGAPVQSAHAAPKLSVSILARGLSIPWDITWVGGLMLFNERGGKVWSKRGGAAARVVKTPLTDLFASGEGGLMGMVADPDAARNKRIYVCYTSGSNGRARDVRVVRWRLTSDTSAVRENDDGYDSVVVDGMPISSGRHSGCRLRFGPDRLLYVGTGDAARGTAPQDLKSLGGKVLRVRGNGSIPTDNPFFRRGGDARHVWSYGHRNIQGLAFRPGTRELWSAEHGPDRDDEVNLIARGADYGWNPVPDDSKDEPYNEDVPMTDPGARDAKWSSGPSTVATSGLTFLADSSWGRWQGALAVALLKDQGIKLLHLNPETKVVNDDEEIPGLGEYGRIRTVQYGPDGALYFTTSNSRDENPRADVIGRIAPTAKPPTVTAGTDISPVAPSAVRTGKEVYAFIRTTGDRVDYKRSRDGGKTWSSTWTDTGLKSTSAPSVASSVAGRVDIVTRNRDRTITHTRLIDGKPQPGQINLGGATTNATVSSLGDKTLDVFALRTDGVPFRKHFNGSRWSGWQRLPGPRLTSRIGASAEPSTGATRITGRGTGGTTYERNLTRTGNGPGWVRVTGLLWSGRALGDRYPGRPIIAMSRTYDGYARWQRGVMTMVLDQRIDSEPDVVTRPDGTWLMFARNRDGGLSVYDARPGAYGSRSLGGVVR